jgi:hypothetical protein
MAYWASCFMQTSSHSSSVIIIFLQWILHVFVTIALARFAVKLSVLWLHTSRGIGSHLYFALYGFQVRPRKTFILLSMRRGTHILIGPRFLHHCFLAL